jgi:hypothetical protein
LTGQDGFLREKHLPCEKILGEKRGETEGVCKQILKAFAAPSLFFYSILKIVFFSLFFYSFDLKNHTFALSF